MSIRIAPGADDMVLDERPISREREIEIFEQRVAAKALDYLKKYGDIIPLANVDNAMDGFSASAAEWIADEVACSRCGDRFPARMMSNVHEDTNQPPRRVCVTCLWGAEGN